VAIVVPDPEVVVKWAADHGKAGGTMEQLCAEPALAAAVLQQMTKLGRADKLQGFEMVKAVHIHTELFSMENGLLTPTFKLKRQQARDRFRANIDTLYASLRPA
jgi:long-chain acyl-CoA synthetase